MAIFTVGDLIKPTGNGDERAMNTTLTGRKVEELFFFNAQAITTTDGVASDVVDLSKYKQIIVIAIDTHDQNIDIFPQIEDSNVAVWNGSSWEAKSGEKVSLSIDGWRYYLNSFYSDLLNKPVKSMRWIAQASSSPTSGSLTIKAWGVVN